jgi:excisionase family DNA binding protein
MTQIGTTKISKLTSEEIARIRRDPPAVLTLGETAVFLRQSERKTRDDIRLRRIPHLRLGGRILVRRADLERALAALVVK